MDDDRDVQRLFQEIACHRIINRSAGASASIWAWLRVAAIILMAVGIIAAYWQLTIFLPALAISFAAFCVWLTVRIVNRRERWAIMTAINLTAVAATLIAMWWLLRFDD